MAPAGGVSIVWPDVKRQQSIEALVHKFGGELELIRGLYPAALEARCTDMALDILVSDCLQHMRQALDFLAHDINDSYRAPNKRTYFPWASRAEPSRAWLLDGVPRWRKPGTQPATKTPVGEVPDPSSVAEASKDLDGHD